VSQPTIFQLSETAKQSQRKQSEAIEGCAAQYGDLVKVLLQPVDPIDALKQEFAIFKLE